MLNQADSTAMYMLNLWGLQLIPHILAMTYKQKNYSAVDKVQAKLRLVQVSKLFVIYGCSQYGLPF